MRDLVRAAALTALLLAGLPAPLSSQQAEVILHDFEFSPAEIRVSIDEYGPSSVEVRWTNNGPSTHTVTADAGAFDSKELARGATFSFRFQSAGTFAYHCNIHSEMKGQVIVAIREPGY